MQDTSQPAATKARLLPRKGGMFYQGNNGVMFWRSLTASEWCAQVAHHGTDWTADPWLVGSINRANR